MLPTPRPLGFDDVEEISDTLESQQRDQRRLKQACLQRDGGRCMITGAWAEGYPDAPEDESKAATHAVHIVPFSLGNFTEDHVQKTLSFYNYVNY